MKLISKTIDFLVVIMAIAINFIVISDAMKGRDVSQYTLCLAILMWIFAMNIFHKQSHHKE